MGKQELSNRLYFYSPDIRDINQLETDKANLAKQKETAETGLKKCLARSFLLVMVAMAWLVGNWVSSAVVLLFYSLVSLPWLNHYPSYFFMIAEPYQSFDENIFLTLNTDLAENLVNRKILRILNIQVSMHSNHNTKEVRIGF